MVLALNFLTPLAIIVAYSTLLVFIGLPLSLACLPRPKRWLAVPLSPLIAMALISCAYEYNFYVLMQPYRPLLIYGAVVVISVVALVIASQIKGERFRSVVGELLRGFQRIGPLLIVPLLAVLIFCGLFVVNGLELLSAGQDEFAYVQIARHITEHFFTRDALDFPWARADHYLSDITSRQAYWPGVRLGAFSLLADISYIFNVSVEKSFPLLIGVGIFVGAGSLALLGLFVRQCHSAVIAAQILLATSSLLVMLHFQGSLSHVCTLGLRLGGLGFIIWSIIGTRKIGPLVLSAVLSAGWLVLYYESIGFGLALSLSVCVALSAFHAVRDKSFAPLLITVRSGVVIALTYLMQPELLRLTINFHKFILFGPGNGKTIIDLSDIKYSAVLKSANKLAAYYFPPILGYSSLYDGSEVGYRLAAALSPFSLIIFVGIASIAVFAFWRRLPVIAGQALASVPFALAALSLLMCLRGNSALAIRSAQFSMPYIFIGLALFIFARGKAEVKGPILSRGRIASGVLCAVIVGLNSFAVARTIYHVNRSTDLTDTLVKHFDPESGRWELLRALSRTDDAPVLLSGFQDTPTTHMIGLGLRSTPTLLGQTITSYWSGVDPNVMLSRDPNNSSFFNPYRHWLSSDELLERVKASPVWNWPPTYTKLLASTRRAIVPISGSYPPEWGDWPSLFGAKGWRFVNLCDVLERGDPAFVVAVDRPAAGHDELGPYWSPEGAVEAKPRLERETPAIIEVRYTGLLPQITVNGVEPQMSYRNYPGGAIIAEISADVGPNTVIAIHAEAETRMRSVGLYIPKSGYKSSVASSVRK